MQRERIRWCLPLAVGLGLSGWISVASLPDRVRDGAATDRAAGAVDFLRVVEVAEGPYSDEIRRLQRRLNPARPDVDELERLGWLFVAEGRLRHDPGFHGAGERCATAILERQPEHRHASLLLGHVWHNLHRFEEAETLGRELVDRRGSPPDHGLLGDVLMEQGKLEEAAVHYQRMMDLAPDAHAFCRTAHLRFLRGDLEGAIEALRRADDATSPRHAEMAVWIQSRLAFFQLQAGRSERALDATERALQLVPDCVDALHARARILLAADRFEAALEPLRAAVGLDRHPDLRWALAEALRETGYSNEADAVERELVRDGDRYDPRGASLFLASRGHADRALSLALKELAQRQDVHTLEAAAWAHHAAGHEAEALELSRASLREGTSDARLLFHAAVIHRDGGDARGAGLLRAAKRTRHLLLPSQRRELDRRLAAL